MSDLSYFAKQAYDNRHLLQELFTSATKPSEGVDMTKVRRWGEDIHDAIFELGEGSVQGLEEALRILDRVDRDIESVVRSKHGATKPNSAYRNPRER